jgi:DNA-binding SARP family transcriptional activator
VLVRILGQVDAVDGDRVVALPRRMQRGLLAFLALQEGRMASSDTIVDALWGERPPVHARDALHNNVAQLRSALGAETIRTTQPAGYRLDLEIAQIDFVQFEAITAAALATDDGAERARMLREALALWRGPPLADVADLPFAALEAPRLADRRTTTRRLLVDAELALGRHTTLIAEIEALADEQPYDRQIWGQLMLAYYRAGRDADALNAFDRAARGLDEIGVEPGPELHERQRQILNHDPALLLPRPAPAAAAPVRKVVTVVFAAPAVPGDEVDPERLRAFADRSFGEARAVVERHGGTVERLADSSLMAVLGIPTAHEDDALRAVRAAVELNTQPQRFGIATGEVLADPGGGAAAVTGAAVAAARQAQQAAGAGEILLHSSTLRLVRAAVKAEPVGSSCFRLTGLVEGAPSVERHFEAGLVDREHELAALREALEQVLTDRTSHAVTVVGEAGIGKTRLARELLEPHAADVTILVGRCVAYGVGATNLPLREMVEQAGGDLTSLLTGTGSVGEAQLSIRRYFESLAARRPLALVFEDIHWAEPPLLDLIEYLGEQLDDVPVFLLCLARPDLLESRSEWPVGPALEPLSDDDTRRLLGALPGALGPAEDALIVAAAEGNPLYAEQLRAYAVEGGELGLVPPPIESLLAGRLDRLDPEEREALRRAAVVGRAFSRRVLAALWPDGDVDRVVSALTTKGLLRRGRDGVRFHHVLIRDVAYASLTKAERSEHHARLAEFLDAEATGSDELLGYHLERAYRYRVDVGTVDAAARVLADAAGARLGAAGIAAAKRGDAPAAVDLLGRAADLLPEGASLRLDLLCELGVALRAVGDLRRAEEALARAALEAEEAGDRRAAARVRLELANVRLLSDPGDRAAELIEAATAAIPVFEAAHDERGLARAWRLIAYAEGAMRCRYGPSADAAERALAHCLKSGWSTATFLGEVAVALYYGPTPVAAGVQRCRSLLRRADLGGEAVVSTSLGGLEAMRGRFAEARSLLDRARALYEELGQAAVAHAMTAGVRGETELLAGDAAAAERVFRESYDALAAIGDRAYLATRAAQLAEAVFLAGRRVEAFEWSRIAERDAGADDVPTQFIWRAVRARLLAAEGDPAEAEALARRAASLAESTDALAQRAKVVLDLADVQAAVGRPDDAAVAARQALALFEEKGHLVGAGRASAMLTALAHP